MFTKIYNATKTKNIFLKEKYASKINSYVSLFIFLGF